MDEETLPLPIMLPTTPAYPYRNNPIIEQTTPTYPLYNPYEPISPYPPPPPTKRKINHFVLLFFGILLVTLIASTSFLGIQMYEHQSDTASKIMPSRTSTQILTPTPQPPTPTPIPTVSYYASDIYNDFYANGLGGSDPKNDTNWSCCTYTPAGGAIVWTDRSGYILDIATFLNIHNAEVDAGDLYRDGYFSNVVHDCLLSYNKSVPTSVLGGYVQLMQIYCN